MNFSFQDDEETVAHLLPCKHYLHNACLKPWVERANSCPTCRTIFNTVELSESVGGPVLDSYAVQDKVQEAELDPSMIPQEELHAIETFEPCIVCSEIDDGSQETMYCDSCDRVVHVFCAGYDNSPETWYCGVCLDDMEAMVGVADVGSAIRRQPRRRAAAAPRRHGVRNNEHVWAQVWQHVAHRLDLDLDFPFSDDQPEEPAQPTRAVANWQRRLELAAQQGASHRLRAVAASRLDRPTSGTAAEPESQEELRAWNAFDKARESQEAPLAVRRRKRKTTASPNSPHDSELAEQRQLKRPRLRRPPLSLEQQQAAESSLAAAQENAERSTFLTSLLKDVESKPISAGSPENMEQNAGPYSPRESSHLASPTSSGPGTPRALSPSPPPQRPMSPRLSSTILPMSSPIQATFSPFSPTSLSHDLSKDTNGFHHRGRRRPQPRSTSDVEEAAPVDRASSHSPSQSLSYSAKQEIQRMVKSALAPRYKDKEINKDQYTDINRDVSRKLYDMVGNASALADQPEREKWQAVAGVEVGHAIDLMAEAGLLPERDAAVELV